MIEALEQLKKAFHEDDAAAVRAFLDGFPELKTLINQPLGSFDSPAVVCAGWHRETGSYAATVEALVRAGAVAPRTAGGSNEVKAVLQQSLKCAPAQNVHLPDPMSRP